MNKYLTKIAEKTEDGSLDPYLALAGAGLLYNSPDKLLGYHKLYHGTSNARAKQILDKGFDPRQGGSGAATLNQNYVKQSQGKIHFTKNPAISRIFSAFTEGDYGSKGKPKAAEVVADALMMRGKSLTARVPDSYWKNMKPDPDMGNMKGMAATFKHKVDPKYVTPMYSPKAILPHLSLKHVAKYVKSNPKRFLSGAAMAAGGTALTGYSANRLLSNSTDEQVPN